MAAITGIMADRVAGCESTEPAKTSRQAGHELPPVGSQAGETVSDVELLGTAAIAHTCGVNLGTLKTAFAG